MWLSCASESQRYRGGAAFANCHRNSVTDSLRNAHTVASGNPRSN
jgi:hypothetical protein